MNDKTSAAFIEQLADGQRPFFRSILSYPHPFTDGGVILVVEDDTPDLLSLIGEAHRLLPPGLSLHCLRQRELFQLSLPGLFAPPFVVNERPFLPHWLQHKGRVWLGEDVRHLVQPRCTTPLVGRPSGRLPRFAAPLRHPADVAAPEVRRFIDDVGTGNAAVDGNGRAAPQPMGHRHRYPAGLVCPTFP